MLEEKAFAQKVPSFRTSRIPFEQIKTGSFTFVLSSSRKNMFCVILELNKVKTSQSSGCLKPENEKDKKKSFRRCRRLGESIIQTGIKRFQIKSFNIYTRLSRKTNKGVLKGLTKTGKSYRMRIDYQKVKPLIPHNGCRPPRSPRKKNKKRKRG
uniref:Ribosomal protein S11 n=1 Tax=Ishige okamurae TaxID=233772 RepID=A0A4Y5T7N7_9PHAE|nr:ribosomal protein S11 [Ishige okamurae]